MGKYSLSGIRGRRGASPRRWVDVVVVSATNMKAMLFSLLLVLPSVGNAEETAQERAEATAARMKKERERHTEMIRKKNEMDQEKKELFKKIEEKIRPLMEGLEPTPEFQYPDNSTLKVSYKTQTYKVYARGADGKRSETPHDEIGPSASGFILSIHLGSRFEMRKQQFGPQKYPDWTEDAAIVPILNSDLQIMWRYGYGAETDKTLLQKVKQAMGYSSR